jgi:hypothetical protein
MQFEGCLVPDRELVETSPSALTSALAVTPAGTVMVIGDETV